MNGMQGDGPTVEAARGLMQYIRKNPEHQDGEFVYIELDGEREKLKVYDNSSAGHEYFRLSWGGYEYKICPENVETVQPRNKWVVNMDFWSWLKSIESKLPVFPTTATAKLEIKTDDMVALPKLVLINGLEYRYTGD